MRLLMIRFPFTIFLFDCMICFLMLV